MANENIKIEDNFLEQEEFDLLRVTMTGDNFPWFFRYRYYALEETRENHSRGNELDKFQFTHIFYDSQVVNSGNFKILSPILHKLDSFSMQKIRANLHTRLPTLIENTFHTDMDNLPEEKLKQWITSIFYVNTNDGYTVFEDGTKVESVANRMLTFPANMKHTGTSCTDKQTRIVINFNYYKK